MGIDSNRFKCSLNPEFFCSICGDVFLQPVQRPLCEHVFCRECIESWLEKQNTCPQCRKPLNKDDLKDAPLLVRTLLGDLELCCDFESHGCEEIVKLDHLKDHVKGCPFNPDGSVVCAKGCGSLLKRKEVESHSCLSYLLST